MRLFVYLGLAVAVGAIGYFGICRLNEASAAKPTAADASHKSKAEPREAVVGDAVGNTFAESGEVRAIETDTPRRSDRVVRSANFERARELVSSIAAEFSGRDRLELLDAVGAAMAGLSRDEQAALLDAVPELRDRQVLAKAALTQLMKTDPRQAADFAARLTDPLLRGTALQDVGAMWAARDLHAARAWALTLGDPAARVSAVEGVARQWMQSDPGGAYAWAATLDDPTLRDPVFLKLAKTLTTQNPRQALEWAMQFPAGVTRDQAVQYAVAQWAERDVRTALAWSSSLADAKMKSDAEVSIARAWANREPAQATQWAASLGDGQARATALQATLLRWAETQPAAAASWFATQPHVGGEALFTSVTQSLLRSERRAAEHWVASASNPAWRQAGEALLARSAGSMPRS